MDHTYIVFGSRYLVGKYEGPESVRSILDKYNAEDVSIIDLDQMDAERKYVINPQLISEEFRMFSFRVKQPPQSYSESVHLSDRKVHERYNQECCYLFNMFDNREIDAKKLDAALKSLAKKYYYSGTDCCRFIHCGDVAGTSLSRPSSLEGAGNPSTSGYPPGTHACGRGVPVGIGLVNNNGDSSSRVKHSPPGTGKVHAGRFANVSGDATGSMNGPCEGDLETGRVNNNNGDPLAPGDVPLSVVPHVGHTADRSGEFGVNVARTVFRVSAAAASRSTTSNFAKASYAISLADSGAAILIADTHWKAATPILAKAGIVACGVGVLADMGKDLPLPLFTGAIIAAIFIIIAAMVFAKRLA